MGCRPVSWLGRSPALFGAALAACLAAAGTVPAATIDVAPGGDLQQVVAAASPGDTLRLAPGSYGGVVIDKPLTIEGPADRSAVIDGGGQGKTITVKAPDVVIRRVTVRGSGLGLFEMDAGIFLDKTADRALVEENALEDNLIGVYIWGPKDAMVRANRIVGRRDLRMSERGSGIQLWNTPGSKVIDNDVEAGRDGIFTNASRKNVFRGNRFRDLRFAVHYMYTNDSEVSGNTSIGNHVGYAIMYSDRLVVRDNVSDGDRDHGLLLNSANGSEITGNVVRGGEKCVFIYNANKNRFTNNRFEGCEIGIHFTAGSERNEIAGNAFIGNRTQVMYVGTRYLDWSFEGRGNYWSDNPGFDLDGNGVADSAYRPNDVVDQVVWRFPAAKLLLNSPATQVVRWAQSQLPALHPGGVVDTVPLMAPPEIPAAERLGPRS
ncbi:MAG: nitrous oxide reductase family maturation protein NosD [Rhodospirillales bacterium]|nr:nitrous oxide reductase family maturation protein NosD [Rhodospirillales bacterium]